MIKISIVIPTFRRRDLLEKCLTSLCFQDFDPALYEMIVADDDNNLETKGVVLRFQKNSPPTSSFIRWSVRGMDRLRHAIAAGKKLKEKSLLLLTMIVLSPSIGLPRLWRFLKKAT